MKKLSAIIAQVFFFASVCLAQVNDNFLDGDFTNNPMWVPGAPDSWVIDAGKLRSNVSIANASFYITTPSAKATQAQWEFWVNLQFNTSSANYVDVFLMADQSNLLSTSLNGYFVRIGGTPDDVSLYKVVNGITTMLINGADGVTNSSNNTLRIKVIRDADNLWTLQRDATGGMNFGTEGTVTDNALSTSQFFGIRVQQSTASFFNRHFFDDIYAGDIIFDTEPPVLQHITVVSQNQLQVVFNEVVELTSAQAINHYTASNGLGNPISALLQPDEKTVLLTFAQNFQNAVTIQLTIRSVQDIYGNGMIENTLPFTYYFFAPVTAKDIILTEIFADPTPQVGLPDAEFVELYNRSTGPVNLAGWRFTDGSSTATLPSRIVLPGQYLILTSATNASVFTGFGPVVGLANFPTLNNAGEALMLRAPDNHLIDSVNFNLAWYNDEDKQAGGWTLELIDVNNTCGEETNWTASEASAGGTPGAVNSVNTNKPDLTGPRLQAIAVITDSELLLTFDEKIEKPINIQPFSIAPPVSVTSAQFVSTSLRQVKLTLDGSLMPKQLYTLTITSLRDCAGNEIQAAYNYKIFALPEAAAPGDVLINEILFNPRPGGVDFVELVNTSTKYINLKNWLLANFVNNSITNTRIITSGDYILPPASYVVVTSNGSILKNQYPLAIEENFIVATIPAMNDDTGSVALASDTGINHDYLIYAADFHAPILKDKEGVSLERIATSGATNNRNNWKSASSASGFATPGYINSNSKPDFDLDGNQVQVDPEIFSPDRPGQNFTQVHYRFDQTGWVANIKIADQQGRVIKELANNETLGYEGFIRWDGDRDDGTQARMGYYFVWFEVFQLDGQVKTFRKRVVLAR
ncbi:MAG: lamin tail domain-containing protein [Cyclobacteriaceae bacterium]|nr:lamin tail domain-containing protein [Cyclobacteriaceae bacterium]